MKREVDFLNSLSPLRSSITLILIHCTFINIYCIVLATEYKPISQKYCIFKISVSVLQQYYLETQFRLYLSAYRAIEGKLCARSRNIFSCRSGGTLRIFAAS